MTATTVVSAVAPRRAIVVGTKEVTFTPYVIRKVGEVRAVEIDGEAQAVIYNERRNLTYLTLDGVTGRIAEELIEGGSYASVTKSKKVAPPAGKRVQAAVDLDAAKAAADAVVAKKARKPKVAA